MRKYIRPCAPEGSADNDSERLALQHRLEPEISSDHKRRTATVRKGCVSTCAVQVSGESAESMPTASLSTVRNSVKQPVDACSRLGHGL